MSFLAPLYLLGALAISLPIIVHLIRRSPRGRTAFSSLMFLGPSPPRVTRRSRLDDLSLLLLRAAAILLLAAAFARPFVRTEISFPAAGGSGKRVVLLLDTSASMRRGDLWTQALARVDAALVGLEAADDVALYGFDDRLTPLVSFDDAAALAPGERLALLGRAAADAGPTWGATDLGAALLGVADAIDAVGAGGTSRGDGTAGPGAGPVTVGIVLISDLQRGSRLDALASYAWPKRVALTVERVGLRGSSNAGVSLLAGGDAGSGDAWHGDVGNGDVGGGALAGGAPAGKRPGAVERIRVRVANEPDSARERFTLAWERGGPSPLDPRHVVVPPGESRVVTIEPPGDPPSAGRLVLGGDDEDFDNAAYVVPPRQEVVTVLYIGADAAAAPEGLRFYAERALAGGTRREVRFVARSPTGPPSLDGGERPRLVILAGEADDALLDGLIGYADSGGTVLQVLTAGSSGRSSSALLGAGIGGLVVEEAGRGDYAMLGEIDFAHPLFAAFADPRFSDFTRIRFWRHRRLKAAGDRVPDAGALARIDARVIARFDDGEPALLEKRRGEGRVLVLASGWGPSDSQLARSSKFVPLLERLLESPADAARARTSFLVGEPIPLGAADGSTERTAGSSRNQGNVGNAGHAPDGRKIRRPDGTEVLLDPGAVVFEGTDRPGIYEVVAAEGARRFAVNLSPLELRTAPMPREELERLGVRFAAEAGGGGREREARDREAESSQKIWRWLVAAALGILILETWLAGRTAAGRTAAGQSLSGRSRAGQAAPEGGAEAEDEGDAEEAASP